MNLCTQRAKQTCKMNLLHRIGTVMDGASEEPVKEGLLRKCFRQKE